MSPGKSFLARITRITRIFFFRVICAIRALFAAAGISFSAIIYCTQRHEGTENCGVSPGKSFLARITRITRIFFFRVICAIRALFAAAGISFSAIIYCTQRREGTENCGVSPGKSFLARITRITRIFFFRVICAIRALFAAAGISFSAIIYCTQRREDTEGWEWGKCDCIFFEKMSKK